MKQITYYRNICTNETEEKLFYSCEIKSDIYLKIEFKFKENHTAGGYALSSEENNTHICNTCLKKVLKECLK